MAEEADLLSLGKHCSVTWCNQLDFLPFNCAHCKKIFCLEHRMPDGHECQDVKDNNVQVPVCPLCGAMIKKSRDEDLNTQVEKHLLSGCKELMLQKAKKTNKCSLRICRQNEIMPFYCQQCGKRFCIRHRHPQDHSCTALNVPMVACC